ncbi:MAG: tubulin-like doman-containing protein [Pseudomonadota bacterium]
MNIVIGVGGTGAKVVEATIHLALMGIGPREMKVGFVDQDESNGNLNRARQVFESYVSARQSWRGDTAVHRIDGTGECPLLKTDIQPLGGDTGLWIPDSRDNATLASTFGPMGVDRHLFDALFETGGSEETEEQKLPLENGYRGRPHVGATVMSALADETDRFWEALIETIKSADMVGRVRIVLAGSVFGGTGAAGFPTIARIIRQKLRDANIDRNIEVGGVLMLPYFGFPDPNDEQDQNVARANQQLVQSRGALRHYFELLKGPTLFDQLYLIGDFPFSMIDHHSKGSGDQRNPALFPELLGASSTAAFFNRDTPEDPVPNEVRVAARKEARALGWHDLPAIEAGNDDAAQRKMHEAVSQFLRFAVALKYWKTLFSTSKARDRYQGRPWYRRQELDDIDWETASPSTALEALQRSVDHALRWCRMIEAYATRDQESTFELWRIPGTLVSPVLFEQPNQDPAVSEELSGGDYQDAYEVVARKYMRNDDDMPDDAALAEYLTEWDLEQEHALMGRMVAALYHFSQVRHID